MYTYYFSFYSSYELIVYTKLYLVPKNAQHSQRIFEENKSINNVIFIVNYYSLILVTIYS